MAKKPTVRIILPVASHTNDERTYSYKNVVYELELLYRSTTKVVLLVLVAV